MFALQFAAITQHLYYLQRHNAKSDKCSFHAPAFNNERIREQESQMSTNLLLTAEPNVPMCLLLALVSYVLVVCTVAYCCPYNVTFTFDN